MLLSVKPYVYDKISAGTKIFEHRRCFPAEPIKAYLYVSSPMCAIQGIIILKNKHSLKEWEQEFADDKEAVERIKEFEQSANFAMEIHEFYETNAIPLSELRREVDRFVVPQMYYFLDDRPLLRFLEKNLLTTGKKISNSFDKIGSTMVCRH